MSFEDGYTLRHNEVECEEKIVKRDIINFNRPNNTKIQNLLVGCCTVLCFAKKKKKSLLKFC